MRTSHASKQDSLGVVETARLIAGRILAAVVAFGCVVATGPVLADGGPCSRAASLQLRACRNEIRDDFYTAKARCIQLSATERKACLADARADLEDAEKLCQEQLEARDELCDELGDDAYDPDFAPAKFDDDFRNLTNPNRYFPLAIGNHWEYAGGGETVVVEVLDKTKLIEGVTCIVVNDRVEIDGKLVEDTDDWYGQRKDGTVDYCGESVREFETFQGDNPEEPELVEIAGSWKTGRDGALAGTQFLAAPSTGTVYRQEWAAGNAEDAARILSTSYSFGSSAELDEFVPQAVADLLCDDNCVVTGEFTPIDPSAFERKYYAPGIGMFLAVNPAAGEAVQLVGCSFDARCAALPTP